MRWLALLLLASCDAPPAGDTYQSYAKGFFATWCTRCHSASSPDRNGAPGELNWDEEMTVRLALPWIRRDVSSGNMPWNPPAPPDEERARLVRWIDSGAP
jgi:hypothetical protein